MDTGKLLKIIEDIQKDEQEFGFQSIFQNILNFYIENNRDAINTEKEKLHSNISLSLLSNYVMTDYKILEGLEMTRYFGISSQQELDRILGSQAHEVKPELEAYVSQRQEVLNKLENIKNPIIALGIKPRILEENQYEIGFSFPEEYADIASLQDVLGDIKNFLTSLAYAFGEEKSFKITSVSNGSIQIFIQVCRELAEHFDIALERLLEIYGAIKAYLELKKGYQSFIKKRKDKMEQINEEEMEDGVRRIVDNLVKTLNIENPDKDEKEVRVRELFKKMLKHFKKGVSAEVRTPSLTEPQKPSDEASDDEKKNFEENKQDFELKKVLDERNKQIFILQQNNFYGIDDKLLDVVINVQEEADEK